MIALGLLGLSGLLGTAYVARSVLAERRLLCEGARADATVLAKKPMVPVTVSPAEPSYLVTYRFQSSAGPVTAQARVTGLRWSALRVSSPLGVRYCPAEPERNLPDGATHLGRAWLWGGVSLGCALLCGLLLGGLVAARRRDLGIH
ncbi:MAG: DUF3592 domain-containing protein [Polyangiaceae bacterium]|nr:DUF3592 domain-containing protein [Polyangiaceae bacterium]